MTTVTRTCSCGRAFQVTGRASARRKRCDECMQHGKRQKRQLLQMIVEVDSEGTQDRKCGPDGSPWMQMTTLSYGREDGSSGSFHGSNVKKALMWLIDTFSGHYIAPDGAEYRQVLHSFHFGYDADVILKAFNPLTMQLVHKAQARENSLICRVQHKNAELQQACTERTLARRPGLKRWYHAYDRYDIKDVLLEGGEGDVIAWDPESQLALAYTPGRRLYVEDRPLGDLYDKWRSVDIHDSGKAFEGSLEQVIEDWNPEITAEQRKIIAWGKSMRGKEGFQDDPFMVAAYSEAECIAQARVVRMFLQGVNDAFKMKMQPDDLFGPGSVAKKACDHYRVPRRLPPGGPSARQAARYRFCAADAHFSKRKETLEDVGRMSYFGGLIPSLVVGLVRGAIDEADIRSAYPAEATQLPCMQGGHGSWEHAARNLQTLEGSIGYKLVTWNCTGSVKSLGPFNVRLPDGSVQTPAMMLEPVWVTIAEYRTASRQFGSKIKVHETLVYTASCDCKDPFWWVGDAYNKRRDIKVTMKSCDNADYGKLNAQQLAIKKVINSVYGINAQYRPEPGVYTNFHYAAAMTGGTRAKIREKAWEVEAKGGLVVYVHTDGEKHVDAHVENDLSGNLGTWEVTYGETEDLFCVQAGLAAALKAGKGATRGVSKQKVDEKGNPDKKGKSRFVRAVEGYRKTVDFTTHPREWPTIVIPEETRKVSIRMAYMRGKPWQAGNFETESREISFRTASRWFDRAEPVPGRPGLWQLPVTPIVMKPASLRDIDKLQKRYTQEAREGVYEQLGDPIT